MYAMLLVVLQHADNSEIRILKIPVVSVLLLTYWRQALIDVKLV